MSMEDLRRDVHKKLCRDYSPPEWALVVKTMLTKNHSSDADTEVRARTWATAQNDKDSEVAFERFASACRDVTMRDYECSGIAQIRNTISQKVISSLDLNTKDWYGKSKDAWQVRLLFGLAQKGQIEEDPATVDDFDFERECAIQYCVNHLDMWLQAMAERAFEENGIPMIWNHLTPELRTLVGKQIRLFLVRAFF